MLKVKDKNILTIFLLKKYTKINTYGPMLIIVWMISNKKNISLRVNMSPYILISGPIPFIVVGEIFRQEPRAAAMSFSLAFNWICNFILMLTFRFIQVNISSC